LSEVLSLLSWYKPSSFLSLVWTLLFYSVSLLLTLILYRFYLCLDPFLFYLSLNFISLLCLNSYRSYLCLDPYLSSESDPLSLLSFFRTLSFILCLNFEPLSLLSLSEPYLSNLCLDPYLSYLGLGPYLSYLSLCRYISSVSEPLSFICVLIYHLFLNPKLLSLSDPCLPLLCMSEFSSLIFFCETFYLNCLFELLSLFCLSESFSHPCLNSPVLLYRCLNSHL